MNVLSAEAYIYCYVDAASFLGMIVLLLLSERLRRRGTEPLRIFYRISLCVTLNCVFCFLCNAMYGQSAPWCHTVAVISKTLWECCVLYIVYLWVEYVNCKLYGGRKRRTWLQRLFFLPLAVFALLLLVNLFTGIVFTFSAKNEFEPKGLFYAFVLVDVIYFCASAIIVRFFDRKSQKARFLRIRPMLLSIGTSLAIQYFTPYEMGIMGFAIGVTLLYFSMIDEYRFVDEESGMYSRRYLAYLIDMALAGKNDTHSALILDAEGDLTACFVILRDLLHRDGDVIRAEEKRFLVFSGETSRSTLQYRISLVDEAVERHNTAHPEEKLQITARCRMRGENEDAFTFLRTVMDEKEGGDEMRGIVSMISELDRLDKELKLASDIQINMLPMNFPPFPDRREFDLYASMNAAKEVGGDFYDFFLVDSDHLALVIADVSGKGIPAALFMMVSKTLIKNQLMTGITPAEALANVNLQLCERNEARMFVTVWAAVVEISTGNGLACNAGHENPGIRQAGGRFELISYKHNIFLGVSKKARYQDRPFTLHPGDCLFVYTDGVSEAKAGTREMFGDDRLTAALNLDPDAAPEELIGNVRRAVSEFVQDAPQFDDITMLSMKYYGSAGAAPAADPD